MVSGGSSAANILLSFAWWTAMIVGSGRFCQYFDRWCITDSNDDHRGGPMHRKRRAKAESVHAIQSDRFVCAFAFSRPHNKDRMQIVGIQEEARVRRGKKVATSMTAAHEISKGSTCEKGQTNGSCNAATCRKERASKVFTSASNPQGYDRLK